MVVHLVEHLVIGRIPVHAVHDEVGNGTEQVLLHPLPLGIREVVVHAVVGDGGMHEPYALVERLPEDATRRAGELHGVESQRGIELGVLQQHVDHIAGIALVAGHLPSDAAVEHLIVVELVLLVGVTAAAVFGLRHDEGQRKSLVRPLQGSLQRAVECGHRTAPGTNLLHALPSQQQRGVSLRPGSGRETDREKRKQNLFMVRSSFGIICVGSRNARHRRNGVCYG